MGRLLSPGSLLGDLVLCLRFPTSCEREPPCLGQMALGRWGGQGGGSLPPELPPLSGACGPSPPAGHPDGVRDAGRVLGPRPRGPAHGAVRGGALQRAGAPGQALGEEQLRGEDPRRWLPQHYQIALPASSRGWRCAAALWPKSRRSRKLP